MQNANQKFDESKSIKTYIDGWCVLAPSSTAQHSTHSIKMMICKRNQFIFIFGFTSHKNSCKRLRAYVLCCATYECTRGIISIEAIDEINIIVRDKNMATTSSQAKTKSSNISSEYVIIRFMVNK